jgi:hypothetical protein
MAMSGCEIAAGGYYFRRQQLAKAEGELMNKLGRANMT